MIYELGYGQSTTVPVGDGYFMFVITRYKSGYEAHLEDGVGQEWGWEGGGQDLDEVIADCEETAAAMVATNTLDCTGAEARARAAAYIGPDALMEVIVDAFRERYPHAPTPEIKEMPEMDGAPHGARAHFENPYDAVDPTRQSEDWRERRAADERAFRRGADVRVNGYGAHEHKATARIPGDGVKYVSDRIGTAAEARAMAERWLARADAVWRSMSPEYGRFGYFEEQNMRRAAMNRGDGDGPGL